MRFQTRSNQAYGWPFYMARKALRGAGQAMLRAADELSQREKLPVPFFGPPITPANRVLHNAHIGRRCFIVGNGPSLATQDLGPLRGELIYAMNGFVRHPLARELAPKYYLFADPVFFDGSETCDAFLARVREEMAQTTFIAPYAAGATIAERNLLPAERTHYVAYAGILRSARLKAIDLTRPLPAVINSAQLALMCALSAGCTEIYLLGLDHNWLAMQGHEAHFYPGALLTNHAVAHADMTRHRYRDLIEQSREAWQGYEAIAKLAEGSGVRIVNCTAGGYLDVFPRGRYEAVVGRARAA